jgi:hypothetical protein
MRLFGKEIILPVTIHAFVRQRRQSKIQSVVKSVCSTLEQANEDAFLHNFQSFNRELSRKNSDRRYIYRKILRMYGGMGSFNDLVLYKNGTILKGENTKLSKLSEQLYSLITEELRDRLYLLPR